MVLCWFFIWEKKKASSTVALVYNIPQTGQQLKVTKGAKISN